MSESVVEEWERRTAALLDADLTTFSEVELRDAARRLVRGQRQLELAITRVVGALDRADAGRGGTRAFLTAELHLHPRQAGGLVTLAADLAPTVDRDGALVAPAFPLVAQAQGAGRISTEQARAVIAAFDQVPDEIAALRGPEIEAALVRLAVSHDPKSFRQAVGHALAPYRREQIVAGYDASTKCRHLTLVENADGTGELTGHLTSIGVAFLKVAFDRLAGPAPGADGTPDPRRAGQRRHDALLDLILTASASKTRAGTGTAITLLVTGTPDEFQAAFDRDETRHAARVALGQCTDGTHIPLREVLGLADTDLHTLVTNPDGVPLHLGRSRRLATAGQRLALIARDGGCSFPGCDRPPGWAEAHHIRPWRAGGGTDLPNLTPLCRQHHDHHEAQGWRCTVRAGLPYWIPPTSVDPDQTPRRNPNPLHPDNARLRALLASVATSAAHATRGTAPAVSDPGTAHAA